MYVNAGPVNNSAPESSAAVTNSTSSHRADTMYAANSPTTAHLRKMAPRGSKLPNSQASRKTHSEDGGEPYGDLQSYRSELGEPDVACRAKDGCRRVRLHDEEEEERMGQAELRRPAGKPVQQQQRCNPMGQEPSARP